MSKHPTYGYKIKHLTIRVMIIDLAQKTPPLIDGKQIFRKDVSEKDFQILNQDQYQQCL